MHDKLICNLYALLCWKEFYSCKKWVIETKWSVAWFDCDESLAW
jgi:hypothetical protein